MPYASLARYRLGTSTRCCQVAFRSRTVNGYCPSTDFPASELISVELGCQRNNHPNEQEYFEWTRSFAPLTLTQAKEQAVDALGDEAVWRAHAGSDTLLIFLLNGGNL